MRERTFGSKNTDSFDGVFSEQPTLDAKVSRKVLAMARDQQDELALEDDEGADWEDDIE